MRPPCYIETLIASLVDPVLIFVRNYTIFHSCSDTALSRDFVRSVDSDRHERRRSVHNTIKYGRDEPEENGTVRAVEWRGKFSGLT